MAQTKLSHRAFALSLALLFLVTSLGFSGLVIWQLLHKPKDPAVDQAAIQKALQQENKLEGTKLGNFTPITKVDQLQSIDLKDGSGETVKPGATVTAHYTGAIAGTGVIFESSHDGQGQSATFPLSQVIKGWTEGVPGMKVGGTRRLIIPAELAYGPSGSPPKIGPNEPLVFDIELISVKNP